MITATGSPLRVCKTCGNAATSSDVYCAECSSKQKHHTEQTGLADQPKQARQTKNYYPSSTSTGRVAMIDAFAMAGDYDAYYERKRRLIRWLRIRDYLGGALLTSLVVGAIYIGLTSGIWK